MSNKQVRALRGATTVTVNEAETIVAATTELLQAMLQGNGVIPEDIISIVFTATGDLDAAFPAEGARRAGLPDIPLMCAAEIAVPGGLSRCVRVLMHLYTERDYASLRHTYLGEARRLRTDLPG